MKVNMLEEMYQEAKTQNADIVVCGYDRVAKAGNFLSSQIFDIENIDYKNALSLINPATWNKIYSRQLFIDNKISFLSTVFYEDLASTHELFYFSKKAINIKKRLYNYFINPRGSSQKLSKKKIDDIFSALEHNKNFLLQKKNLLLIN